MASTVIGGALAQWPLGLLSDKVGRRKTMFGAASVSALFAALIVLFVDQLGFVGINLLGAAWGFFAFPIYAISVAHANDYADSSDYVMVSSGLLLMYGIGAIIGPFAASAAMAISGVTGLYLLTGFVHALLAVYAVQRIVRRTSAPVEEHIAFADALATAHTASQVYEEEILHQAEDET